MLAGRGRSQDEETCWVSVFAIVLISSRLKIFLRGEWLLYCADYLCDRAISSIVEFLKSTRKRCDPERRNRLMLTFGRKAEPHEGSDRSANVLSNRCEKPRKISGRGL